MVHHKNKQLSCSSIFLPSVSQRLVESAQFCSDFTFKPLGSVVPNGNLHAESVTYTSLVELLNAHHPKKQSTIVDRYKFNTCWERLDSLSQTMLLFCVSWLSIASFHPGNFWRNIERQVSVWSEPPGYPEKATLTGWPYLWKCSQASTDCRILKQDSEKLSSKKQTSILEHGEDPKKDVYTILLQVVTIASATFLAIIV